MKNLEALKAQCKLICNTCYVDDDVVRLTLFNSGLDADSEAVANNPDIVRAAIVIVNGWAETSRSENGISASVDMASVKKNILFWCNRAGLDASEFVSDMAIVEDGSNMW